MAIFARVVEANSFSRAAERLRMSKAAVSKHVTKLERSLGARLLNRTTRRLSLTEAGQALYDHSLRLVAEAEAAEIAVSKLRSRPRGVVRVTTSVAFGTLHVAPAIPDFLERYPEVGVHMVMDDRQLDLASEGLDIAVRMASEPAPQLVARRLAPVRWAVCAAPDYAHRHGIPRTPRELAQHNCLLYSFQESSPFWRFKSRAGRIKVPVAGNFTVGSSLAMREAALRGLGIALLPTFVAGSEMQAGRLQVLLPGFEPFGMSGDSFFAVYLPTRYVAPKVRAFVDFFVERFMPIPYWDRVSVELSSTQ